MTIEQSSPASTFIEPVLREPVTMEDNTDSARVATGIQVHKGDCNGVLIFCTAFATDAMFIGGLRSTDNTPFRSPAMCCHIVDVIISISPV